MPKITTEVCLWDFPRQDFPLWKKLCADEDDFETYDEYQAGLNRVAAMLKAGGNEVVWLDIPVANFMIMLSQRGLENTSANRAKALEQIGREQHMSSDDGRPMKA